MMDAAAKGPEPTRTNRLREIANQVALFIMVALASIILVTICVTVARGEGNHSCTSCGSPRGDTRSGTYRGNPGGFYATQGSITGNGHTLGQIATAIGNAIGRTLAAIGDFYENNIRYHYKDDPNQYGIAASPG